GGRRAEREHRRGGEGHGPSAVRTTGRLAAARPARWRAGPSGGILPRMPSEPRVLVDGLRFPEGPRWHEGRLWLSDMHDPAVLAVDLAGRVERIVEVPAHPSGLGWLPDGRLLVVSMRDRRLLRLDPEGL